MTCQIEFESYVLRIFLLSKFVGKSIVRYSPSAPHHLQLLISFSSSEPSAYMAQLISSVVLKPFPADQQ